ncbi:cryptochrome/photolyase family protein [Rhabdothermincola salaria]|uniref:cryptochrome/photolyase family protein n=1 Tax=Rhabdothermincola salaria TaxID=2903142 RepID=UPI001E448F58|nr:deoxyribodipyrimidine photo-lyase [Rhabdothermincola salaria]MCD9624813.1 DNA photolyase family protein [Rhabdothermincola salaria]
MADDLAVVWFRRDLRLEDNPAWAAATAAHDSVLALYVLDPVLLDAAGAHRRDRFLHDLGALDHTLRDAGGSLRVVHGAAAEVVPAEVAELGAVAVYANADVTPYATARDEVADRALAEIEVDVHWSWGTLVHPPGAVLTNAGDVSQVFTPFHRTWSATALDPWPEPGDAEVLDRPADGLPAPSADYPLVGGEEEAAAEPGERGAAARLAWFLERVDDYRETRDRPGEVGSSQLSADLRFGTLSPRRLVEIVGDATDGRKAFVRQVAWRDWYAHTLWRRPDMVTEPLKAQFAALPWRDDPEGVDAWRRGRTGIPLVDAGMRQLVATGWVHNRVRLVVGSFLTKNLLVDWRIGERWFRHHLMDGDVAQNVGNWQWVAGTGPDASPFHRVFNPVLQSRKFDPDGAYLRRWLPELAQLSGEAIHAPWEAGPLELAEAGVVLDDTYPAPIVDLGESRERALGAYEEIRRR